MKVLIKQHWALMSVICIYWITMMLLLVTSTHGNQGHLIYPLDDTYIHMAIAKNVVLHNVWGITKHEFTSSTSSPLWTLLLVIAYFVFGVNELSPLLLNLLFGTLMLLVSYLFLKKYVTSNVTIFVLLVIALFVTPLPSLTFLGMEHVLHALLTLCFVYFALPVLSSDTKDFQKEYVALMVLAPFVTTIRFEGVFLVFVACVLLLMRKKVSRALLLGAIALLPVIAYGLWSVLHGWYFLPNSLLLKGNIPSLSLKGIIQMIGYGALNRINGESHIQFLLMASLLVLLFYIRKEKAWSDNVFANLIFISTTILHMQFAGIGWFYRYESYLVLLGIITLGITASSVIQMGPDWGINKKTLPQYAVVILVTAVAIGPFWFRAIGSLRIVPQATTNIYEQQYQMGLFLRKYYQDKMIPLNDIGAASFLADIRLLDLWGLGSLEPTTLRIQHRYTTEQIYNLANQRDARIAIVYDKWFDDFGGLPPQWIKVGQWRVDNNVVLGGDKVSFYAVDRLERDSLSQNLGIFADELPETVDHVEFDNNEE